MFQHTAARRRLETANRLPCIKRGFNTQPPEGGWSFGQFVLHIFFLFQHTAARRRLGNDYGCLRQPCTVSTHSRPKAAGQFKGKKALLELVSTHSRPKAAGITQLAARITDLVSTHSRPKAAGQQLGNHALPVVCFNTQPPEGGWQPTANQRPKP